MQLIDRASLILLERRLIAAGQSVSALYDSDADWENIGPALEAWIDTASVALAHAIWAALAVIDFRSVVIDGAFPKPVHKRIVDAVVRELKLLDLSGLTMPDVRAGTVGTMARALGGASLPLFDRFLVDQHTLSHSGPAPPRH